MTHRRDGWVNTRISQSDSVICCWIIGEGRWHLTRQGGHTLPDINSAAEVSPQRAERWALQKPLWLWQHLLSLAAEHAEERSVLTLEFEHAGLRVTPNFLLCPCWFQPPALLTKTFITPAPAVRTKAVWPIYPLQKHSACDHCRRVWWSIQQCSTAQCPSTTKTHGTGAGWWIRI